MNAPSDHTPDHPVGPARTGSPGPSPTPERAPGPDSGPESYAGRVYAERWWVPASWWAFAAVMVASLWFAAEHAMGVPGHVIGALAAVLCGAGLGYLGSTRVLVDGAGLSVGTARAPRAAIGSVLALTTGQARTLRGPAADATARMFLRPYLSRGVRVEITDPTDPTPYWYVASRHPERLAAALERAPGTRPVDG
ncbi:Protein of unknown function [Actinopolymorpha cephalotaxi]|uniref:DUF3093 domain-containing protein n=1 Tax=Actinopolymorpha cephalotaxi TaxID=504797 RepID=A0A1I2PN43_9ACTN|nr:DUF3093 domain-containing protein [Actinopolymorpha cephalotaxi]NYH83572.1 hypothetical protein [Actinopolymorpha cephalotaxi]SFG16549.1 Protein of unknown function [Actinopolymorpha cephalotaxi]